MMPLVCLTLLAALLQSPPASPATSVAAATSLDDFLLPPKTVFDPSMPRYPNVWFYIDATLSGSYDGAVKLITDRLRDGMRLREYFGPFDNPEGCDFETRLEHLQPWEDRNLRALQHSHAFHMRYYHSALTRRALEKVTLPTAAGPRAFYRFAASVHYEVEHTNPNHADVEVCPICGRTGEYRDQRGNLVELVHDPLGLELLLNGTVRGEVVRSEDYGQREVGSVKTLERDFTVKTFTFPGVTADRNTLRLGMVLITPR